MDANVRDYGALGNGVHDDTVAFRSALQAIINSGEGGRCLVPATNSAYMISGAGLSPQPMIRDRMHLFGVADGELYALIRIISMPTAIWFRGNGNEWSIQNIAFDLQDFTNPAENTRFPAISATGFAWKINRCSFVRTGRVAISGSGSSWVISGCSFQRTEPTATPTCQHILITRGGNPAKWPRWGKIQNNVLQGAGMVLGGDDLEVTGNWVNESGYGAGMFIGASNGVHSNSHRPIITGNTFQNGLEGLDNSQNGAWHQVLGIECWADDALIYNNQCNDNCGGGLAFGGARSVVAWNRVFRNGQGLEDRSGIIARDGLFEGVRHTGSDSLVIRNVSKDDRPAAQQTQSYGYEEQRHAGQPNHIRGVVNIGNNYTGNKIDEQKLANTAPPNVDIATGKDVYKYMSDPRVKNRLMSLWERNLPQGTKDSLTQLVE